MQNNGNNQRPNDNACGFFILSGKLLLSGNCARDSDGVIGPKSEMSTMNKRDGSHWEFFNCPKEMTEVRRTVRVVCTVDGPESNCDDIYDDGLPHAVVEMPDGYGPVKYAMAVSLEPSVNHTTLPHRLVKRLGLGKQIFDFTFDHDFTAVNKRAASVSVAFLPFTFSDTNSINNRIFYYSLITMMIQGTGTRLSVGV